MSLHQEITAHIDFKTPKGLKITPSDEEDKKRVQKTEDKIKLTINYNSLEFYEFNLL